MKRNKRCFFNRVLRNKGGAAGILVAVALPSLVGLGALSVDVGYIFYAQRVLQASTDAAALSGADVIGTGGSASSAVTTYGAGGTLNDNTKLTNVTTSATFKCYSSIEVPCSTNQTPSCATASSNCSGTSGANGVEVVQTAQVPTFLARIFGIDSVTISATASAASSGGVPTPVNVALILDTTASMGNAPSGSTALAACSGYTSSAIACAAHGAQILLSELWPWQTGATSGNPVDTAALFVFPPVTNSGQATTDISCTSPEIPAAWPSSAAYSSSGGAGYSGVVNTAGAATTSTTLTVANTMSTSSSATYPEFNTGSSFGVVTDLGTPTNATTPTTGSSSKTLTFPSGVVTTKITAGMTVKDTTTPSAIASGTTVASISTTANTVTMSASATGSGVASGDLITFGTSIPAGSGSWPWWGTGTSISSVTTTTAVMSASPNTSPTGPGILKGDVIVTAPLYQIVGFGNDYRTSDTATSLNSSSNIVKATNSGCLKTPGGLGTFYADAISAAQAALVAEQSARVAAGGVGGTNVIILLSDGDSPGTGSAQKMGPLKSYSNLCKAAVTAAQDAAAAGTKVYAVYYDDNTGSTCSTDSGSYTGAAPDGACYTLQQIANSPGTTAGTYVHDPAKFYSIDGTSSPCPSQNNYSSIEAIFDAIAKSVETSRLIPNGTT
jgi:Flp pilus assembly protein TadG